MSEMLKEFSVGDEDITIDGRELAKMIVDDKKKKLPRKQILRVILEVVIPRNDGTENVDVLTAENLIGITTDSLPSKIMAKIKPQLIDALKQAREHTPSAIIQPQKPSKIILPGDM